LIQELRIYEIRPGRTREYLEHFEGIGLPIASKYMFLAGFWTSEFGALNEIYHLWDFRDLEHRNRVRAALHSDAKWQSDFMPRALELVAAQRNLILRPTTFSPPFNSGLNDAARKPPRDPL
jgi:hypothetical protein